jgi:hypothetical protein
VFGVFWPHQYTLNVQTRTISCSGFGLFTAIAAMASSFPGRLENHGAIFHAFQPLCYSMVPVQVLREHTWKRTVFPLAFPDLRKYHNNSKLPPYLPA